MGMGGNGNVESHSRTSLICTACRHDCCACAVPCCRGALKVDMNLSSVDINQCASSSSRHVFAANTHRCPSVMQVSEAERPAGRTDWRPPYLLVYVIGHRLPPRGLPWTALSQEQRSRVELIEDLSSSREMIVHELIVCPWNFRFGNELSSVGLRKANKLWHKRFGFRFCGAMRSFLFY